MCAWNIKITSICKMVREHIFFLKVLLYFLTSTSIKPNYAYPSRTFTVQPYKCNTLKYRNVLGFTSKGKAIFFLVLPVSQPHVFPL